MLATLPASISACSLQAFVRPRPFGNQDFARMSTVRRILKYTPAVVLGLLVVAWVVTQGGWIEFVSGKFVMALQHGSITGYWQESDRMYVFGDFRTEWWFNDGPRLGHLRTADALGSTGSWFPIPLLCTLILPLAIGPFLSFRLRLWHYFAYTALLAIELAYYLRWQ
jgi:hypothetical protein